MTHFSDGLRIGDAYYARNVGGNSDPSGRQDIGVAAMTETQVTVPMLLGAPDTNDADGICVNVAATGAATLSATGALVSGGVATFDVPRAPSITSTADESGVTFTFTGTDEYGAALVANRAGPNNTTVNAVSAFKTITSVAVDGALTSTQVDVGSSSVLGIPYRIGSAGNFLSIMENGTPATGGTFVAGLSTTGTATATTADVRGTYTPAQTADGSKTVTLLAVVDASTKGTLYGVDQYGG